MAKKRFIFDESYIKKHGKKGRMKRLIAILVAVGILLVLAVVLIVINVNKKRRNPEPVILEPVLVPKAELVIESNSYLPKIEDYFEKLENVNKEDIKIEYPNEFELTYDYNACTPEELAQITEEDIILDCAKQSLITPASYGILLTYQEDVYTVLLKVVDTTPPVLMLNNVQIYQDEDYKISDFVNLCFDINGECDLSYVDEFSANIKEPGEYEIKIVAKDQYDNITTPVTAKLTVIKIVKTLYTVTFNSNGGNEIEMLRVEEGSKITEPVVSREGYNFLGWYNANELFDFETQITGNLILTAKWEEIKQEEPPQQQPENPQPENPPQQQQPQTPSVISVTSISLNYKKIYLKISESKTVTATVRPSNATNKTVTWSSSDPSIATVDNGKITGLKEGTVTILASAGGKTTTLEVVVKTYNSSTCIYGDSSYDTNKWVISQDLTQNGCAIDPSLTPDSPLGVSDHTKLVNEIANKGYTMTSYTPTYYKVPNNANIGTVGYQISVYVTAKDSSGNTLTSVYIVKSDGTRSFVKNEIGLK